MKSATPQPISLDSKAMIDRLLLERVPLARIARVMQVPEDWLQGYVKRCYEAVPRTVQVQPKAKGRLDCKESGLTSYIERFNNTLRQRVSRVVRKTLSFSKNLKNI